MTAVPMSAYLSPDAKTGTNSSGMGAPCPFVVKVKMPPKGKKPAKVENWKPAPAPSKPRLFMKECCGCGSERWPDGRGGALSLGSLEESLPLP